MQGLPSLQVVPFGLTPLSTQLAAPPAHRITPAWQGLPVTAQLPPATQDVQVPFWQTLPPPQSVPFGFAPLSTQVATPPLHATTPAWQGLPVTAQLPPATQDVQVPFWQTLPPPQSVPFSFAPLSTQVATPPLHARTPAWQGLPETGQLPPATQDVQVPDLQTLPPPQAVPSAALPLSTHADTPVAQDKIPLWHGVVTTQLPPAAQATHRPLLHTIPSPHEVPAATPRHALGLEASTTLPASSEEPSGTSGIGPTSPAEADPRSTVPDSTAGRSAAGASGKRPEPSCPVANVPSIRGASMAIAPPDSDEGASIAVVPPASDGDASSVVPHTKSLGLQQRPAAPGFLHTYPDGQSTGRSQ